jgi:hypothetical protein
MSQISHDRSGGHPRKNPPFTGLKRVPDGTVPGVPDFYLTHTILPHLTHIPTPWPKTLTTRINNYRCGYQLPVPYPACRGHFRVRVIGSRVVTSHHPCRECGYQYAPSLWMLLPVTTSRRRCGYQSTSAPWMRLPVNTRAMDAVTSHRPVVGLRSLDHGVRPV